MSAKDIGQELLELLEKARQLEKWPVAKLISLFETDTNARRQDRHQVMSYLRQHQQEFKQKAFILGVTGAPGVGKSSLIGELCHQLLSARPQISVAVLAIDPSSQVSGGALLGDRTRSLFPANEKRLFFRSQASAQDLGGLSKQTFHATRILQHLFDYIVIETVGIGQNEIEVQQLCNHTCLVMQPLAGDQVQFIKAGIMEIPDTFIVNKCDEEQHARRSRHLLESSLQLTRTEHEQTSRPQVFMTSVVAKKGIEELTEHIVTLAGKNNTAANYEKRELHFLLKWVRQQYGEYGYRVFQQRYLPSLKHTMTYEEKEQGFKELIETILPTL